MGKVSSRPSPTWVASATGVQMLDAGNRLNVQRVEHMLGGGHHYISHTVRNTN